jgi:hypothetical protein
MDIPNKKFADDFRRRVTRYRLLIIGGKLHAERRGPTHSSGKTPPSPFSL